MSFEGEALRGLPATAWILVATLAAGTATGSPPPGEVAAPSTRAMAERLRRLHAEADPVRNIVLNERRVELVRGRLAAEDGPTARLDLRASLGYELLLAGRTGEAIDELSAALAGCGALKPAAACRVSSVWLRELLGVAYLRRSEQENCQRAPAAEACIFPLRGGGIHGRREGAALAAGQFRGLLEDDPANLEYRWLLNLAHMALGDYPGGVPEDLLIPPERFASEASLPPFRNVSPDLGLSGLGLAGGGVLDDFTGDGHLDLVVSSWSLADQLRLLVSDGRGGFSDRTEEGGLLGETGGLNLVQADYDNDGNLDLLVLRGAWYGFFDEGNHPNSLLHNLGGGRFEDATERAGMLSFFPTQTAAWADFDNDGWLDLFVGNESVGSQRHPCELYRNNGDGTFTETAAAAGVDVVGMVKGVAWGDFDNDGFADLYLSRFGQPNLLFHNDGPIRAAEGAGGWRFTDVTARAGVAEPRQSFATWFFDFDNDGHLDLFVAPFLGFGARSLAILVAEYLEQPAAGETARLYRNRGDGTFEDATASTGLDRPLLVMGANFGDVDNDGFLDLYLGTGEPNLATLVPNRMFRNAEGRRFQDVTTAAAVGHLQKGHGIAFGDLDHDGDQDILTVLGGAYSGDVAPRVVFENPGGPHEWITLRLEGTRSNRSAIGARIEVSVETGDGPRRIHVTAGSGGSFGASSLQQEIGLGAARRIERLTVWWPASGLRQEVPSPAMRQILLVREGDAHPQPVSLDRLRLGGAAPPAPDDLP